MKEIPNKELLHAKKHAIIQTGFMHKLPLKARYITKSKEEKE